MWIHLITQEAVVNESLYDGIVIPYPAQESSRQNEIVQQNTIENYKVLIKIFSLEYFLFFFSGKKYVLVAIELLLSVEDLHPISIVHNTEKSLRSRKLPGFVPVQAYFSFLISPPGSKYKNVLFMI